MQESIELSLKTDADSLPGKGNVKAQGKNNIIITKSAVNILFKLINQQIFRSVFNNAITVVNNMFFLDVTLELAMVKKHYNELIGSPD